MFSFQQLETLIAVAKTKSFSAAGRLLGKPQSTISTHIGRLEERIGRPLFRRSDGKTLLTEDGEALIQYARGLLKLRDQALARFGFGEHRSVVRFGMPDTIMTSSMLEALWTLSRDWIGQAQIETLIAPSRQLKSLLATGALDIAVALRAQPAEGDHLWRERLAWVSAPGFDTTGAYAALSLVNYPSECPYREFVDNAMIDCALPYSNVYVGGSLGSIVDCLSRGIGIGVLDVSYAAQNGLQRIENPALPALPSLDFCVLVRRSYSGAGSRTVEALDRLKSAAASADVSRGYGRPADGLQGIR